ncbi:hypothetical protein PHMEG_0009011 [Phytophthora megakarya]|uniref:Uncharacterized protein n=1 Tax=Phytophthora megakarya TaxID=4795 RepID=A0A225WHS3_9STRA|nr:hypothetical protein PHMEG_0009011 [Phytophthora megakarya]
MDVAELVVEAMSSKGTISFLSLVQALRNFEEYSSQGKVHSQVAIGFPKNYLTKCLPGIKTYRKALTSEHDAGKMGVTITKLGTYTDKDIITMFKCNCIKAGMNAYAKPLQIVNVKISVSTRFGRISIYEVAPFRLSVWLDDTCFMIAIKYMIYPEVSEITDRGIGVVNPLFELMAYEDIKRELIESTSSFRRGKKFVLVPIYLDSH